MKILLLFAITVPAVAQTYAHDIAPILYQNCASCHHAGGAGPFPLTTYADARRRAAEIDTVTQSRYMPPWLPVPGFGDFADSRRLPDADRATLHRWIAAGMPSGDLANAPAPPTYTTEWQLGPPDLILTMPEAFTTPAGGTDVFRNFILPYPLGKTQYIRAMEILPGTPAAVHHANVLIDRTGAFRKQHPQDWQGGVTGMELTVDAGSTFDPDSHFLFWKPDSPAITEPTGMEWHLDPGDDLILNMHLKPTGKPESIRARIGLYFSKTPATQHPMLLQLEHDAALDIPAGAANFVVEDRLTLPVAVHVLGVYPHAHYLGKQMEAWAILPGGRKQWLVKIVDWDIDRQSIYRYRAPVLLPKSSVIHMHYMYNNSAANLRNPHSPPVRVRNGNRSEDEMGHLWLQVLPVEAPSDTDPRLALEQAWMQSRLRKYPDDPLALFNLAAAKNESGKPAEAAVLYRKLLAANPNDARTLTALGAAQESSGNWQQAAASYRSAITARPDANDARFNLARLEIAHELYPEARQHLAELLRQTPSDAAVLASVGELAILTGDLPEAVGRLQQSVAITDDAATRQKLAMAYAQSGQLDEALTQLQAAIGLDTKQALLHSLAAQVLGSLNRLPEAIAEQQAALALDPNDPDSWNNLGVLHARAGNSLEARANFQHALTLSPNLQTAQANLKRLAP